VENEPERATPDGTPLDDERWVTDWQPEREPWSPRYRPRLRRLDLIVLVAIVIASAGVHFSRLGQPGTLLSAREKQCKEMPPMEGAPCHELIPLDEVHYVPDARDVLRFGTDSDTRIENNSQYVVHPPVGKWFIAAGIWLFGDVPYGWRFFGALLGSVSTVVIYLLARRLWASPWWAAMAALLLSVEGMWFVQSRVAMLDIYAAFFTLVGVWLLLEDRDRTALDHAGMRWWRIGAIAAFGVALATKWSILPLVAMALGMALVWDWIRIGRGRRRFVPEIGAFALSALLIPVAIYLVTYTPWFLDTHRYSPPRCVDQGTVAGKWLCYQREMVSFHRDLKKYEAEDGIEPAHPYFGEAWSWPWIGRPVAHAFDSQGEGEAERLREVLGLPNPMIWWLAFVIGIPLLVWWGMRGGDPVASLLLGMILAGWVPYLVADLIDRPVFLFYATPIVPFLVLAVVHLFVRLVARAPRAAWMAAVYAAMAVSSFAYFYPVLAAFPIPRDGASGWAGRMWFTESARLVGRLADCTAAAKVKIFCWI
jgi:dolichyl-phosphate-mannose--protein O-mannosyl transferase